MQSGTITYILQVILSLDNCKSKKEQMDYLCLIFNPLIVDPVFNFGK